MEENTTGASRGRRRSATQRPGKAPPRAVGTPAEASGATAPEAGEASVGIATAGGDGPSATVGPAAAEGPGGAPDAAEGGAAGAPAGAAGDDETLPGSEPLLIAERVTITSVTPLDETGRPQASEERVLMIRERAYLYAAERGFEPGGEIDDWLRAEREVDAGAAHDGEPSRDPGL